MENQNKSSSHEESLLMDKDDKNVSIEEWREVIGENFSECLDAGEIGLSVMMQLLINDIKNPFGLIFVDVPSAGKTITLNFFSQIEDLVNYTDSFSPASLVSHASNRSKKDLEKIDLLPRIKDKMLVVRDLAPLFAERQDVLLKNLGVLTRVFDGEGYETDSGVHGRRGYKGDYCFMFIAASTPIQPRVWKNMSTLGGRFFFVHMNVGDKNESELSDLLIQDDFKLKENACSSITNDLVLSRWKKFEGGVDWDKKSDPVEVRNIISRCAMMLCRLRATTGVWAKGDGEQHDHTNTTIEKPMRINQLLYNLARGHALSCGRTVLTKEDLRPVIEVALSSAPHNRTALLEALIEHGGSVSSSQVDRAIGCSRPTSLREMETLNVVGIIDIEDLPSTEAGRPERQAVLKKEFEWFTSDEFSKLRNRKKDKDLLEEGISSSEEEDDLF